MNSTQTSAADAKTQQEQEDKRNVKLHVKPDRRRPASAEAEALTFISVATSHLEKVGNGLTRRSLPQLPVLYNRYCLNSGLRGKQKAQVWGFVTRMVSDAKLYTKDLDAQL